MWSVVEVSAGVKHDGAIFPQLQALRTLSLMGLMHESVHTAEELAARQELLRHPPRTFVDQDWRIHCRDRGIRERHSRWAKRSVPAREARPAAAADDCSRTAVGSRVTSAPPATTSRPST
jgi:hypothetical protein